MELTVTPTPSTMSARDALPALDPSSGVLTASTTLTRNAWTLSQDLLLGLGARHDLPGAGRRHDEDITLLRCWIRAYDIRLIVMLNAHLVPYPRLLTFLLDLGRAADCDVALTHDESTVTPVIAWAQDNGARVHTTPTPLIDRMKATARPAYPLPAEAPTSFPKFLPEVDFYAFRGLCRELLPANEFAIVDDLYVRTFRDITANPLGDDEDASSRLRTMLSTVTTESEATTIIRATQAALFKTGRHLYVWMPTLRTAMQRDQHRRLTPAEVRSLRGYRTPWRSSLAVLHDAELTSNDIAALTLADLQPTGHLTNPAQPLTDDARAFLRAHREFRRIKGATEGDPLFTMNTPGVRAALRSIGRDLLIPTVSAQAGFDDTPDQTWRKALGVRIATLT
ncbi:hypothetical protein [Phycicoccus duodecadis]|uniref:Uncharacterized protein n=1 Tax=Phycicoccus duodecadis TaxID=173053 RepID=A0A2N3YG10_9MICO|nr:hypothetical protein [Phycicoccus duodecadis]PKW25750.1 hypothetical protein ATL31_0550 [Phycicoccus duodecadis]